MIVDTLTHVWESPEQLGRRSAAAGEGAARRGGAAGRGSADPLADRYLHADPLEHFESLAPVDIALVFSFQSRLIGANVPARLVGNYVRSHADRLIGVAGIDPTAPGAADNLDQTVDQGAFKAVAISPAAQGFHPMDSRAQAVYRGLIRRNLPLFVYPGPYPSPAARLAFADPILLDEVLAEFPDLKLVLGGLTHPWMDHSLALMTKHPNVLASVGGLLRSPWQAYNTLAVAQELGVLDRVLFASDFPFALPAACIEALYSINRMVHGTNLPTIPRELLRGIVERDALELLGIDSPKSADQPRRDEPAPLMAPAADRPAGADSEDAPATTPASADQPESSESAGTDKP